MVGRLRDDLVNRRLGKKNSQTLFAALKDQTEKTFPDLSNHVEAFQKKGLVYDLV